MKMIGATTFCLVVVLLLAACAQRQDAERERPGGFYGGVSGGVTR